VHYRRYVTVSVEITGEKKAAKQFFKREGNLKIKIYACKQYGKYQLH
jgi:hypothetical protein